MTAPTTRLLLDLTLRLVHAERALADDEFTYRGASDRDELLAEIAGGLVLAGARPTTTAGVLREAVKTLVADRDVPVPLAWALLRATSNLLALDCDLFAASLAERREQERELDPDAPTPLVPTDLATT